MKVASGFTKLFSSIVHSTIWREPNHVRVVWVTMLALADRDGVVEASLPGLADASRVTLDECKEALALLSGPDEHSRTQDHEGRRIRVTDGGWLILNHGKYREKMSVEDQREKSRIRQENWRKRHRKGKPLAGETAAVRAEANGDQALADRIAAGER